MVDKEQYEQLVPALQLLVDGLDEAQKRSLFRRVLDPEQTIITRPQSLRTMNTRVDEIVHLAKDLDGSSPMGSDAQYHIRQILESFSRAWKHLMTP